MKPLINIDTTNDKANITLNLPNGSMVQVIGLKLGETGHLTMDQADQHARATAKQALHSAIAAL